MSNGITTTADHQQAMDAAEAAYRNMVLKAGVKYETPDGSVITPKQRPAQEETAPSNVIPMYETDAVDDRHIIDLDIEEVDSRDIILRGKDGTEIPVHIPAPRMDAAFMVARYERLIGNTYDKLSKTASDAEAERLNKTINDLYIKMVRYMVPDMDATLLKTLNMRVVRQIVAVGQEMIQASMSMSNMTPLTYVRRIYRLLEQPHGDSDRGLLKWLSEHFADIEAVYGENESPNV